MAQTSRPPAVPWVPIILLLLGIGIFWILPAVLGDRPLELQQGQKPTPTSQP